MPRLVLAAAVAASGIVAVATAASIATPLSNGTAWEARRPSEVPRTEVAAAAVGRRVYVVGGFTNGGAPTRQVERYDTRRDRWRRVAPMPIAVNHAVAVSYRGDLYVLGGYTGAPFSLGLPSGGAADASSAFFRYDPRRDSWSRMPAAPTARGAMAAAVIRGRLYVAGGADLGRPLTRLEIFDFESRRWRRGPSMPLPTEHVAGAAARGDFYAIAGRPFYGGGTNRFVQRYDPQTRRWTRVADVRTGRAGFAAATVCGRIVVFGGEDPGRTPTGTIAEVERYHPRRDVWTRLPDMRTPRHGLGGAAVGRRVYALEGGPVTFLAISNVAERLRVPCPRGRG